jgi:hypothetical protein
MVENRQKGITNAYPNDKKDVDTRESVGWAAEAIVSFFRVKKKVQYLSTS